MITKISDAPRSPDVERALRSFERHLFRPDAARLLRCLGLWCVRMGVVLLLAVVSLWVYSFE